MRRSISASPVDTNCTTAKSSSSMSASMAWIALPVFRHPFPHLQQQELQVSQSLGEWRRAQRQLDARQRLEVADERRGDDCLHLHRGGVGGIGDFGDGMG